MVFLLVSVLCALVIAQIDVLEAIVDSAITNTNAGGCAVSCEVTLTNCDAFLTQDHCDADDSAANVCEWIARRIGGSPFFASTCVTRDVNLATLSGSSPDNLNCAWQNAGVSKGEVFQFVHLDGEKAGTDCVADCQKNCGLDTCWIPIWKYSIELEAVGLNGFHAEDYQCHEWKTTHLSGSCDKTKGQHPGNGINKDTDECLMQIANDKAERMDQNLDVLVANLEASQVTWEPADYYVEEDLANISDLKINDLNSPYSWPYILLYIFGFLFGRKATFSFTDSKKRFENNLERLAFEEL